MYEERAENFYRNKKWNEVEVTSEDESIDKQFCANCYRKAINKGKKQNESLFYQPTYFFTYDREICDSCVDEITKGLGFDRRLYPHYKFFSRALKENRMNCIYQCTSEEQIEKIKSWKSNGKKLLLKALKKESVFHDPTLLYDEIKNIISVFRNHVFNDKLVLVKPETYTKERLEEDFKQFGIKTAKGRKNYESLL